ncbi:uncharacterized protein LOC122171168 [Centrocercus urophasianus]|uniref:uncharacterized protein LOC122171168 n=1 Tax=Centrocercus urophasianus TaxID=9002 RepID=UPI001C646B6C|nr:uncharacterized protein LOC122171168 [Centrocercus urophasianus]
MLSAQGAVLLLLGIWHTGNPCAGLTQTSVLPPVPGQRHQAEAFPFCWNEPMDFFPQKPVREAEDGVALRPALSSARCSLPPPPPIAQLSSPISGSSAGRSLCPRFAGFPGAASTSSPVSSLAARGSAPPTPSPLNFPSPQAAVCRCGSRLPPPRATYACPEGAALIHSYRRESSALRAAKERWQCAAALFGALHARKRAGAAAGGRKCKREEQRTNKCLLSGAGLSAVGRRSDAVCPRDAKGDCSRKSLRELQKKQSTFCVRQPGRLKGGEVELVDEDEPRVGESW